LVAAASISFSTSDAEACGGFFCDQQQPINQAAERIIFSDNPDDTVTAVVQILYQGPSERFAWVLPVPSVPEVSVSSNLAFQRLQAATNPNYQLNTVVEGECREDDRAFAPSAEGDLDSAANNANQGGDDGVDVLAQGTVGPYDYTVIDIDRNLPDPTQSATDWLTENGYDLTELGPEVIRPYIEEDMFLIAFKLTKNAMSGDIRPVVLDYETDTPSIPIKLTAVAANEDMGVMTWVLGESRAVPMMYKSLIINDALINWFNPATTYDQVISRAADEAQGQGFVTEFAGSAEIADRLIFTENDATNWEFIQQTDWSGNERGLVVAAWNNYAAGFSGPWDGWPETINGFFGGLSQQERDDIIGCAPCDEQVIPDSFDAAAFISELEENVIKPMQETQDILDARPYMTRMYTTMSAAEMTVDPVFDFNADLPDVSNQHTADRIIECTPDVFQFEAPWRVELPSGQLVRGQGQNWPLSPQDDLPANAYVLQDSTEGGGVVVEDNTRTIQVALSERNAEVPSPPGFVPGGGVGDGEKSNASACSMVGASALPVGVVLGFLALVGFRRRP